MLAILFCIAAKAEALPRDPNEGRSLYDMSLEELMQVPLVVSASRQEQRLNESSAPISIISWKDIHYSGVTNIPEILQYVPGVDVVKFNRLLYGVGVHGMTGGLRITRSSAGRSFTGCRSFLRISIISKQSAVRAGRPGVPMPLRGW